MDESKMVKRLGRFPLPVEVVEYGFEITIKRLQKLGCRPLLRLLDKNPYITDNGNYIIDCDFGNIEHPECLHNQINLIPGVVENGLFINLTTQVISGYKDGTIKKIGKEL